MDFFPDFILYRSVTGEAPKEGPSIAVKMSKQEVLLLDFWISAYSSRVKIALAEKGVEYESVEEDVLGSKSDLLLNSNPVYKKVPVLLHNGKPVCESIVIVNYVDEAWPSPPLLPTCPYQRAHARFWADFIDRKIFEGGRKIWVSREGELKVAKQDFMEALKQLEGPLGEKDFFGGEDFGFVDIILIPVTSWFYSLEKFGGFEFEDECPKLSGWVKRCMQRESVVKSLPQPEKIYEFIHTLRKKHGLA